MRLVWYDDETEEIPKFNVIQIDSASCMTYPNDMTFEDFPSVTVKCDFYTCC